MKNSRLFIAGAVLLLLLLASAAWYLHTHPVVPGGSLQAGPTFTDPIDEVPGQPGPSHPINVRGSGPAIIPKNAPVVTGFLGQLAVKGNPQEDGTIEPFVVGEYLKLEAETLNAVEFRWTVNGEVLKEKGQEWSTHPERFYDVTQPGPLNFTVQVRGADKALVSLEKATSLNILPLKIMHLTKAIIHDDDEHFITGESINLEVEMATSMVADLDFYQFRYFVNDSPVKDPDDGEEWTTSDTFSYTFAAPGNYTFKVEARRASVKNVEDTLELPETVVAADAVLLSFDSSPSNETGSPVGSPVNFSAFPTSRYGKSECRIGVKKINAADFTWLNEDTGSQWGDPYRTWLPLDAGTYLVRCEIREIGKETADDFREMVFTVTDGNF